MYASSFTKGSTTKQQKQTGSAWKESKNNPQLSFAFKICKWDIRRAQAIVKAMVQDPTVGLLLQQARWCHALSSK